MFGFLRRMFGGKPAEEELLEPSAPSPGTGAASVSDLQRRTPAPEHQAVKVAAGNGVKRHVIVGGGPAGVIAAETLRKVDPHCDILMLHGEPGAPYSRMAIPYYLTGMIDEAGTHLRKTSEHYERLKIRVGHGWVEQLFPDEGRVSLSDGGDVPFDRLLLATGSSAIRPPIEGIDLPGVHPCWTMEDARAIIHLAEPGSHVVLMGAGFIGCIILEALAERGVSLTVVEMGDRMVPRMMNLTAGNMLKSWCEEKNVRVLTSTKITKIEPAAKQADSRDSLIVDLDNGDQVPAHLVVVATGVRANTDVLNGTGVKTDQGIIVDRFMRTNHPNVYAAGDVAQGIDFSTGGFSVHAVQPTAADHGRCAAVNMAGGHAPFTGSLVMNVLDTIGLVSCSFGRWQGVDGGDSAEMLDEKAYKYINLQFADDHLVGAIALGRTDWIGVLRGLIQTKVPLGPWKAKLMADPHRIAEAYVARAGT